MAGTQSSLCIRGCFVRLLLAGVLRVQGAANLVPITVAKVRRERRWTPAGAAPPANWFAPPGSEGCHIQLRSEAGRFSKWH
jgi:hypothetical protein